MEPRLNLEPLDPTRDAPRWEARVGRVLADAAPLLRERRLNGAGPLLVLADLLRPALGIALASAALSGLVLLREVDAPRLLSGVPEELGLPTPVTEWLTEDREPTSEDLLASLDREIP